MMSSATGFSPYFLMYGHHPRLAVDIEFGVVQTDNSEPSQENYVQN